MYLRCVWNQWAGVLLGLCLAGCQSGVVNNEGGGPVQAAVAKTGADCLDCSTAKLQNTYWKLLRLGGKPAMVGERNREPYMTLVAEGGRVQGFAGCNRMMGGFRFDGEALHFQGMATTRMACAEGMELEAEFMRVLESVARWQVKGERLWLFDARGEELAEFESRYLR